VKIFVSYSRRDAGDFAEQIYDHLREEHDIFTDVNNIQIGSVWSHVIENNISNCDLFVAIITHAALKSPHVDKEVLQAQKENKIIIPCMHRNIRLRGGGYDSKWGLEKIQGIEFNNKYDLARDLYLKIEQYQKVSSEGPRALNELSRVEKTKSSTDVIPTTMDAASSIDGGNVYFYKREYNKALDCYEKALDIDPNNGYAWYYKGGSLYYLQRYNEAIASYDKAIKINPDYAEAWIAIGLSLHNLQRYNEAIASYDKAIKINPDYAYAWHCKGGSLHNLQRYNEAIECYDKAIKINPDYAEAWIAKGYVFYSLQRYNEAIECYDKAIKINPNSADAWIAKGWSFFKLERYEKAIECYDKAININPDYALAWNNKGLSLERLGKKKDAEKCFDTSRHLSK
jgi:tetratricopeptide (TPR) repeat protein